MFATNEVAAAIFGGFADPVKRKALAWRACAAVDRDVTVVENRTALAAGARNRVRLWYAWACTAVDVLTAVVLDNPALTGTRHRVRIRNATTIRHTSAFNAALAWWTIAASAATVVHTALARRASWRAAVILDANTFLRVFTRLGAYAGKIAPAANIAALGAVLVGLARTAADRWRRSSADTLAGLLVALEANAVVQVGAVFVVLTLALAGHRWRTTGSLLRLVTLEADAVVEIRTIVVLLALAFAGERWAFIALDAFAVAADRARTTALTAVATLGADLATMVGLLALARLCLAFPIAAVIITAARVVVVADVRGLARANLALYTFPVAANETRTTCFALAGLGVDLAAVRIDALLRTAVAILARQTLAALAVAFATALAILLDADGITCPLFVVTGLTMAAPAFDLATAAVFKVTALAREIRASLGDALGDAGSFRMVPALGVGLLPGAPASLAFRVVDLAVADAGLEDITVFGLLAWLSWACFRWTLLLLARAIAASPVSAAIIIAAAGFGVCALTHALFAVLQLITGTIARRAWLAVADAVAVAEVSIEDTVVVGADHLSTLVTDANFL